MTDQSRRNKLAADVYIPPREERDLQAKANELADLYGWRRYHTHDSRNSPSGFPDLILVKDGRMVAAELKSASKAPTTAQEAWLDDLVAVPDCSALVLYTPGLQAFADLLAGKLTLKTWPRDIVWRFAEQVEPYYPNVTYYPTGGKP